MLIEGDIQTDLFQPSLLNVHIRSRSSIRRKSPEQNQILTISC